MRNLKYHRVASSFRDVVIITTSICLWSTQCVAEEVRAAFTPLCPTSNAPSQDRLVESPALILGAIVGTFAGKLVDTGIAALKKTVSPGAFSVDGSFLQDGLYTFIDTEKKDSKDVSINETKFNSTIQCLVVAVGKFGTKGGKWELPFAAEKEKAYENITALLPLSETPILYFEAAVFQSPDKTAFTWRPVRIYIGKYLNDSFWAGQSRSLQLSFKLNKPSTSQPFYSQDYKFDNVKAPFSLSQDDFKLGTQGTWGSIPAASSVIPKIAPKNGRGAPFDPFTLTVQIVEAPKPYKLAAAFVDSVDANNAAIKTEINQLLDPTKKEAANQTDEAQTLAAITAYANSWKTTKDTCDVTKTSDAAGKLACQISKDMLSIALEKANAACKLESVESCNNFNLGVL